jgi:hypothetical protein
MDWVDCIAEFTTLREAVNFAEAIEAEAETWQSGERPSLYRDGVRIELDRE